jgi:glycosyltransferase involved in cell wall biosynthesis
MTKKLNLLMVSDDYHPHLTGVGVYLKTVVPALLEQGHKITILTSNPSLIIPEQNLKHINITILRAPTITLFGFPQAIPNSLLFKNLDTEKFDLVHHHYLSYLMNQTYKFYSNRIPQVMTYHMTAELISQTFLTRPFRSIIKNLYKNRLQKMDQVIAPSKNHLHFLENDWKISKLSFLSNPCPIKKTLTDDEISARKKELNSEEKSPIKLLYVGRLAPEKNIKFIIKVAYELQKLNELFVLTIVGKGPEEKELKILAKDLGVKVRFEGFKELAELPSYYLQNHFFLLSSLFENQGLVLLEALTMGTPCLALEQNISAPEMIQHEQNGYILPNDPQSWAQIIIKSFHTAKKLDQLSQNSLMSAKNYSIKEHVETLEKIYHATL